jgi:glycosyltransferase involved in cell wall biosynthesis
MKLLSIGIDRSIADVSSQAFARQRAYYDGWDVDIVILASGNAAYQEYGSGLRVHTTGGFNKVHALWRGLRLARRMVREHRPDVVTTQDPLWSGMVAFYAARCARTPVHVQDHSAMFARLPYTWAERFLRFSARGLVRRARRVRTVSERGRRGLESVGVASHAIDVIPISTDPARFASIPPCQTSGANVLCIARLEPEKGVEFLLQSWTHVIRERPDAKLRIVGEGALRGSLEQRVYQSGLQASVEFVGVATDIVPHLAWATALAVPSVFEGWGLVAVEAAHAGRPVVMTDVGVAGEIIRDGESGRVVLVRDPLVFARAVLDVVNDPASAQRFAQRAREIVQALPMVETSVAQVRASLMRAGVDRLLVVAQAVDGDDALFGFFVTWLREAAATFSSVTVLALRVGRFDLPANVSVIPLRSSGSRSKFAVIRTLWSVSWRMRHTYDAVFIRGDAIYVVLGAWLWRMLGKSVMLG